MAGQTTIDAFQSGNDHGTHVMVSRPFYKFLIGFIAGFCAALFPRLTAMLLVSDMEESLNILSTGYLIVSTLFATFIGAIIMIMEWNVAKEPRTTFMAALGIPALITGSINTLDTTRALDQQVTENREMRQEVEKLLDIKVLRSDSIQPLSLHWPSGTPVPAWMQIIPSANASDEFLEAKPRFRLNPSIQGASVRYVVVLEKSTSKDAAVLRANELSQTIPAQAIASQQGYLIIKRGPPKDRSEALVEALRIREQFQIQADILEIQ